MYSFANVIGYIFNWKISFWKRNEHKRILTVPLWRARSMTNGTAFKTNSVYDPLWNFMFGTVTQKKVSYFTDLITLLQWIFSRWFCVHRNVWCFCCFGINRAWRTNSDTQLVFCRWKLMRPEHPTFLNFFGQNLKLVQEENLVTMEQFTPDSDSEREIISVSIDKSVRYETFLVFLFYYYSVLHFT